MRLLTEELESMKLMILKIKQDYSVLSEKVSKNQQYSRKKNLIFTCLKTANESCTDIVNRIFMIMEVQNMTYDVCHFLRDKKQIIIKFKTTGERDSVWTQRSKLKGSSFFVGLDLPTSMQRQHSQLFMIYHFIKNHFYVRYDYLHIKFYVIHI